ncbi:MAG: hypothetical protein ACI3ZW_06715 [Parabacteroides sp.]|nr:hypothetical protein [Parabacteroides sp.]MCI7007686.1 hypothetical protein [Parabacteroides sp.]MCI7782792.1 hypothetical protein [Parabacteroides sp.]MDD7063090.1 hypothetical protein [bacterium]MDY4756271.1 hypothetical protein [Parabacteroides sp.]
MNALQEVKNRGTDLFLSRFFRFQKVLPYVIENIAHRFQKLRATLRKTMGNEKENYGLRFSKLSAMFFDAMGNGLKE